MTMLSPHFRRDEFACKCKCAFDTVDAQLITMLEDVRLQFNRPILITSGCRCKDYNSLVGGSKKSQHLVGRAADFIVKDVHPHDVYDYCDLRFPLAGLGKYSDFTHIDSRGVGARWGG